MGKNLKELKTDFLEYLEIERNCSMLTIKNYDRYLSRLIDYVEKKINKTAAVTDLTIKIIRKFRLNLAHSGLKPVTSGYYVIALRSFLKWMAKNDIRALAAEKLEVPKTRDHSLKFLDQDQIQRLLNQPVTSNEKGLRDRVILELLFSTGLRVSELVALNVDQMNLKTREFGVVGKGGRARVVFISRQALPYLEKYLWQRRDKYRPLFINYSKKRVIDDDEKTRLTARSVQRLVKGYVHQAKLTVAATPHTLRHSLATDLLRSGADLRSVQEILGHKNISTTQIYTHVTDARLKEVHEKFHQGNREG